MERKKILLIADDGLDGTASEILSKVVFGNDDLKIVISNRYESDDDIKEMLTKEIYQECDVVYVVGLPISTTSADAIQKLYDENKSPNILYISNDEDYDWMNKYKYAVAASESNGEKQSNSSLLYMMLTTQKYSKQDNCMDEFIELIRQYCTGDWIALKSSDAKLISMLYNIIGKDNFIERYINEIQKEDCIIFGSYDKYLVDLEKDRIKNSIDSKDDQVISYNINGYNAGVVFADVYIEELANKVLLMNPQYHFIVVISTDNTLHFKTLRKDLDISAIARTYNGTGSKTSAEGYYGIKSVMTFLDAIFK